jgi:hypothetical protein
MAIPLETESPIRRTLGTASKVNSLAGDFINQLIKQKQSEMDIQQAQAAEERKNQLFPEELKKLQMQNELFKPQSEADIANKTAQTNRMNFQQQNPLYGQAGTAGQIGAAELLRRNPQLASDPNASNIIMNALNIGQQSKQSSADLNQKRAEGYTFHSLPVPNKSYLLAQAAGMGIEPNEAAQRFNKGETIDQMASNEGFDPNNKPDPIYPLTTSGQTSLKQRQAALTEMGKLGKTISDWSAPYSRKIMGFSPNQIKDALTGKNKDQQAKFLAARMLFPEQSAIRLRSMSGNVGIEAIRELTDKAMGNGRILESLVSPDVYQKANDLVEEAIGSSVEAANKKVLQAVSPKKSSEKENNESQYNEEWAKSLSDKELRDILNG